jgi:hypothetical protein
MEADMTAIQESRLLAQFQTPRREGNWSKLNIESELILCLGI